MWKPLATHARDAGIPEPSARRYLASFKDWFQTRKAGKGSKTLVYGPQTPEILKAISEGFGEGKRRAEVEQVLVERFPQPVDVKPIPKDAPPPAQAPTSAPVDMQGLGQLLPALIPLAERFVVALEAIAAGLAPQGPQDASKGQGDTNHHPDHETGQEGADIKPVDKDALVREVMRLRAMGYGAARIRTAMVRAGWPSLAGPGHRLSKSTVAKIIKSNGDAQ